jgi:hypothetical protein
MVTKSILSTLTVLIFALITPAQISVTREGFDNTGDAANLSEVILTPAGVGSGNFGKLFSLPVDGSIYAMPLYLPNQTINGTTHNVVYVATMNDVVYAFDADTAQPALWTTDFRITLNAAPVVSPTNNIDYNVGVEATPVIDTSTGTLYVVSYTSENGVAVYRLHALSTTTGAEKFGGSVIISGSYQGVNFNAAVQQQRPGLIEDNGVVWIEWGSFSDQGDYNGWVIGYSASTLQQQFAFADEPTGSDGGIWMAGHAPVIDSAGNVYLATGNGVYDGVSNFGDSFLKFSSAGTLLDWFTPSDFSTLAASDEDLGSAGPILIPRTSLLVGGGKEGILYVTNTSNLGHEWAGNTQIVQQFNAGYIHANPAYDSQNGFLYIWGSGSVLSAYPFNGSTFNGTPAAQSTIISHSTGGAMTVTPGIVWATVPTGDALNGTVAGTLYALQANSLVEIWDSNMNASRDSLGTWSKFREPLVVNGKIYTPSLETSTASGVLNVYGLLTSTGSAVTSSAAFVTKDTTTEGEWSGKYGSDGFVLAAGTSSIPSYAAFSAQTFDLYTWAASTSDPRALSGAATCWYGNGSFTVNVGTSAHQFALYLLDWDMQNRVEKITIADAGTGTVLDTETVSSFGFGVYLVWNISGKVTVSVTLLSGINGVASGLFFATPSTSGSSGSSGGSSGSGSGSGSGSSSVGSSGSGTPSIQLCAGSSCITVPSGTSVTITD